MSMSFAWHWYLPLYEKGNFFLFKVNENMSSGYETTMHCSIFVRINLVTKPSSYIGINSNYWNSSGVPQQSLSISNTPVKYCSMLSSGRYSLLAFTLNQGKFSCTVGLDSNTTYYGFCITICVFYENHSDLYKRQAIKLIGFIKLNYSLH